MKRILAMLMLVGCGKDDPAPTDDPKQSTAGNEQDETQKPTEDPADGTTVAPEETNPPLTQVYWVWAEGGLNVRSGPGKTYEATIYRDADDAHYKNNPQAYVIEKRNVTFHDYLPVKMAPGGGFAISFEEK